jgi:hypothetical protein
MELDIALAVIGIVSVAAVVRLAKTTVGLALRQMDDTAAALDDHPLARDRAVHA